MQLGWVEAVPQKRVPRGDTDGAGAKAAPASPSQACGAASPRRGAPVAATTAAAESSAASTRASCGDLQLILPALLGRCGSALGLDAPPHTAPASGGRPAPAAPPAAPLLIQALAGRAEERPGAAPPPRRLVTRDGLPIPKYTGNGQIPDSSASTAICASRSARRFSTAPDQALRGASA
jgi:hypothetical protein